MNATRLFFNKRVMVLFFLITPENAHLSLMKNPIGVEISSAMIVETA